jgi:hypothetical protein
MSELTESVVALAPDEIDVVRARRGETLRFNGLPFARVRSVAGASNSGSASKARGRTPLDDASAHDLLKLVAELREHRRADAPERNTRSTAPRPKPGSNRSCDAT